MWGRGVAVRKRRTQAERSATTREVLLHAAVKCLFEHGYGATTTITEYRLELEEARRQSDRHR